MEELAPLIQGFERIKLGEEKVWSCQSWHVTTRSRAHTYLPLYPMYELLGRDFTTRFHDECRTFAKARRGIKITVIFCFVRFIQKTTRPEWIEASCSRYATSELMHAFGRFFFNEANECKRDIYAAAASWNREFLPLHRHLVEAGILAKPINGLPTVQLGDLDGLTRRTSSSASLARALLVSIPLDVGDEGAKKILFGKLQGHVAAVTTWAEREACALWGRHQHGVRIAHTGNARVLRASPDAPNGKRLNRRSEGWLADCAATYRAYGHGWINHTGNSQANVQVLYAASSIDVSEAIGAPVTGSLLPHAVLLVANHPEITPAFLDSLELTDRRGREAGLVETETGHYLVGYKRRKGAAEAEQKIKLNARTLEVVRQVIELTEPMRQYL